MKYVYSDDVFIVLKSHYQIKFILIPAESFTQSIIDLYDKKESDFEKVWYRWENNNLRFRWVSMLEYMNKFKLNYIVVDIDLSKAKSNKSVKDFLENISQSIEENLKHLV